MKVKLSVYKNDQIYTEVQLEDNQRIDQLSTVEFFIGRSSDCHIHLDNPQVSRHHAVINKIGKGWQISKSSNFGFLLINGSSTEKKELTNGDIISINPFVIHVHLEDSVAVFDANEKTSSFNQGQRNLNPIPVVKIGNEIKENIFTPVIEENRSGNVVIENALVESLDEKKEEESFPDSQNEVVVSNEDDPFASLPGDKHEGGEGHNEKSNSENDGNQFNNDFQENSSNPEGSVEQIDYDGDTSGEGDKTKAIISFAQYTLKIFGEFAPYDEYAVKDAQVFIGRDKEKCQIVLDDPEVSGIHSVIKKTNFNIMLEDLDSSNGTILNGSRINQSELSNNDEFVIGSTTFTVIIKSDLLQAEDGRLMPVEENQEMLIEEVVEEEVTFGDDKSLNEALGGEEAGKTSGGSLFSKEALKDPAKRKKIIYIVAGFAVLLLLLSGEEEAPKTDGKDAAKEKNAKMAKKEGEGTEEDKDKPKKETKKKKLTPEEKEYLNSAYDLAKKYFHDGMYKEAEFEIDKIYEISEDGYKEAAQIRAMTKEAYKQITENKEKEERELAEKIRKKQVDDLVAKAKEAVKDKKPELAEGLFSRILELDPEQSDVSLMKMEIDAWRKEKERVELEKTQKLAERNRKVFALNPGKTFYMKKQWFKAINKLEEFLRIQDMDDDLIKDGTKMLEESKLNLNKVVSPILGKARSLKEGQDLKGAYENFLKVLKVDPSNTESLNEMGTIRDTLDTRLRKIYREAIIAESLSLFNDAKEKFQEVQQISPTDNEYYKKSTEKLKDYID